MHSEVKKLEFCPALLDGPTILETAKHEKDDPTEWVQQQESAMSPTLLRSPSRHTHVSKFRLYVHIVLMKLVGSLRVT